MKIEIEIPDWCEERHIFILAGIEMAAYKLVDDDQWHVKKSRCNMCGECCKTFKKPFVFEVHDGVCEHLLSNNTCGLGGHRPWVCCTSMERKGSKGVPNCSIEYEVV